MRGLIVMGLVCFAATSMAAVPKIADKTISIEADALEVSATYPVTGIAGIDTPVAQWVKQTVDGMQDSVVDRSEEESFAWSLNIEYEIVRNDDRFFSLRFSHSDFTGGAHGGFHFQTFTFQLPEGRLLTLSGLLDGRRGMEALSEKAIAGLIQQAKDEWGDAFDDSSAQWIREGAGADWNNFRNFTLSADALIIDFDPYQVAPWSAGPQQVSLPFSGLGTVLNPDLALTVQPSFDCQKARSAVEMVLCNHSGLAQLDRDIAAAYEKRLAASPSDSENTRQTQRTWLKQRNTLCQDQSDDAFIGCQMALHRQRLSALGEQ